MSALLAATRSQVGPHTWGSYVVRPVGRTLWASRTVTVFPPGTTPVERALLRTWHAWPVGGAVLVVAVLVLSGGSVPGVGAALGCVAAGFVPLARATRRTRPRVRSVTVTTFFGNGRPEVHGDVRLLTRTVDTLCLLDRAARAGLVQPVDFEAVWADVYASLPGQDAEGDQEETVVLGYD